eukprot:15475087-Alexandrium_andersonii.AAC.1
MCIRDRLSPWHQDPCQQSCRSCGPAEVSCKGPATAHRARATKAMCAEVSMDHHDDATDAVACGPETHVLPHPTPLVSAPRTT